MTNRASSQSVVGDIMRLGHLLDPGGLLVMPDTRGAHTAGWQSKPGLWFRHATASSAEAALGALGDKLIETARISAPLWCDSSDRELRERGRELRAVLSDLDSTGDAPDPHDLIVEWQRAESVVTAIEDSLRPRYPLMYGLPPDVQTQWSAALARARAAKASVLGYQSTVQECGRAA